MSPTAARRPVVIATRILRAILFVDVVYFVLATLLDPTSEIGFMRDIVAFNLALLLTAAIFLLQRSTRKRELWGWRMLAAALTANVIGDLIDLLVNARMPVEPDVSWADFFFLTFYPLAVIGIALLMGQSLRRWTYSSWVNGLICALGAAAIVTEIMDTAVGSFDNVPHMSAVVAMMYPTFDVIFLLVLIAAGVTLRALHSRVLYTLFIGLTITCIAGIQYLIQDLAQNGNAGTWNAVLTMIGVLIIAFAPKPEDLRGNLETAIPQRAPKVRWWLLIPPSVFVVSSMVILALGQDNNESPVARWFALLAILGAFVRVIGAFWQLSDLSQMYTQARTDDLTGLPNRRAFLEYLESKLHAATQSSPVSLLFLDLDRFKEINDSLGHYAGDELLTLVGKRLHQRGGPKLFRLGGDEYAVVLAGTGTLQAQRTAHQLEEAMAEAFSISGVRLYVQGSFGVATAFESSVPANELLRWAEVAMYDAKSAGTTISTFQASLDANALERLELGTELRSCLMDDGNSSSGEIVVYFQPQVRLSPGMAEPITVGVEALARWAHPTRGVLAPDAFFDLAEMTGMQARLAEIILEQALANCAAWWQAGSHVAVSVNFSAANVQDIDLPSKIEAAIARHAVPPSALVAELTEETLVVNQSRAKRVLATIRQLGVEISIDDYGTGYSSLAYLHNLDVDELKLDRVFVADLASDASAEAIVRSTIELAHTLGVRVVAEGIEDIESARLLASYGCDVGQGYYFAKPMPAEAIQEWFLTSLRQTA